jgi:drug/metabolite transporter (DMT)-like permease
LDPSPDNVARRRRALAALLTVQLFFGSLPVIAKFAFAGFGAAGLASWRIGGAAVVFALWARARAAPLLPWREQPFVLLCAVLGVSGNQLLFLEGLARTSAMHASILTTTIPMLTILAAVALGRERLRRAQLLGVPLALSGVLYLLLGKDPSGHATLLGDLLIVANASIYSVYLVISRDLLARHSPASVLPWLFGWGFLTALPFAGLPPVDVTEPRAWAALAWVLGACTVGTYGLNLYALRTLPSSTVAVLIYLQPFVATALALPLLGEAPSWRMVTAGALTFAGVWIATRAPPTDA